MSKEKELDAKDKIMVALLIACAIGFAIPWIGEFMLWYVDWVHTIWRIR